jgi:minor extracellular serine protease Vpr
MAWGQFLFDTDEYSQHNSFVPRNCRAPADPNFPSPFLFSPSEVSMFLQRRLFAFALLSLLSCAVFADTVVNKDTQNDKTFAKYGVTGKGVIVAIMDRGIDYAHPDFLNADGTTRIKMMWDMSAQNLCAAGNPAPVAYTEAQINAALKSNTPLGERDAVGHGTVTAGIAAGNGSALGKVSAQYAGIAPQADLLIVKVTSEGAPAHGTQPAEDPFRGCYNQALDLVTAEAATLGEPIVGLINSGTQWGPIDGTSAVSREIDLDFGLNNPGYVYVSASGDEGTLPNHARNTYSTTAAVFPFSIATSSTDTGQIWYTGAAPANVTVTTNDNGDKVTVAPNNCSSSSDGTISVCNYLPGEQFYPWQSSGPDRAVWYEIIGHTGAGTITVQGTGSNAGTADVYSDDSANIAFTNFITPGRLNDYSATDSADVAACYNVRTSWTDINNTKESITNEGKVGALWMFSSGGPTRDGRVPPNGGVDISTPGGNLFAAYGLNSYWETFQFNLIKGGKGYYGRQSATSGASPILVGAAALMLQMDPKLTAAQVRQIIHQTATADKFTGSVPNQNWGARKLNILGATNAVAAMLNTTANLSSTSLNFGTQKVKTQSSPQTVTLSNSGTDALGIASTAITGDYVITSDSCGSLVAGGGHCAIAVAFKPKKTGVLTGTITIKDFNPNSPQVVSLTGTGD